MPRTENNQSTTDKKTIGNKISGEYKKASTNKKEGAGNIKVPTARDRAKNFDEGRRNDANSNEL